MANPSKHTTECSADCSIQLLVTATVHDEGADCMQYGLQLLQASQQQHAT
jgi:hypothetical protein